MSVMNSSNSYSTNDNYNGAEKSVKHAVSADDPQFTITFNYELLDDAYCLLTEGTHENITICLLFFHKQKLLKLNIFIYENIF